MKEWMINTATVLFDDSKNDLRALPKTVRLQILTVLRQLNNPIKKKTEVNKNITSKIFKLIISYLILITHQSYL